MNWKEELLNKKMLPVKPANGDFHLKVRVTKDELINLIADFTYNDRNFNPDQWSKFDGERLKKASDAILSRLSV